MKSLCQYVIDLLPKSWRTSTTINRHEDREASQFGFEIEFNCTDSTQLELIRSQIIEMGQLFGSLVLDFNVFVDPDRTHSRRNTSLLIRYKLPVNPNKWITSYQPGIIWYVNLCTDTQSILLEYFLSEDGTNEIPEYYQLCALALCEKYIAPFYNVSYHRTRITTDCYFDSNHSFEIDRFIVAAIK